MKNTLSLILFFLFLQISISNILAQKIYTPFTNPSFEDSPRASLAPTGWFSYDFEKETPPDIHPTVPPTFGVKNKPYDGKTYLGIVTRANGTYESITQTLKKPIVADTCYSFSIYLTQSKTYISRTRWSEDKDINFTDPTLLRIWGGNDLDDKLDLLVQTPTIEHHDWKKYRLNFSPTRDLTFLIFEAYYPTEPTNGHVLLDNLSAIFVIPCEKENDEVYPLKQTENKFGNKLDLFTTIQEEGNDISFIGDNLNKKAKTSLLRIKEKMETTPDYKLLIYYHSASTRQKRKRKIALENLMVQLGFPRKLYEVKAYHSDHVHKYWAVKKLDLLIGLEKM